MSPKSDFPEKRGQAATGPELPRRCTGQEKRPPARRAAATRNAIFLATLAAVAGIGAPALLARGPAAAARRPPAKGPLSPSLELEAALLAQREGADGTRERLSPDAAHRLAAGDELQLLVRVSREAHLVVAVESRGRLDLLYPVPGQSGRVRPGWGYSLPSPTGFFLSDGKPTTLHLIASLDPLPEAAADRLEVVRASMRAGLARAASRPAVRLALRDGTPVEVPVTSYSGSGRVVSAHLEL
jgi:hypothetical protein